MREHRPVFGVETVNHGLAFLCFLIILLISCPNIQSTIAHRSIGEPEYLRLLNDPPIGWTASIIPPECPMVETHALCTLSICFRVIGISNRLMTALIVFLKMIHDRTRSKPRALAGIPVLRILREQIDCLESLAPATVREPQSCPLPVSRKDHKYHHLSYINGN